MICYGGNKLEKTVSILCPNCGTECKDELDRWPSPNIYAETAHESTDCIGGTLVCPKCGKEINFSISEDFDSFFEKINYFLVGLIYFFS